MICLHQRRSQDFCLGGGPHGTFSVVSPGADRIQWGRGGVVAENFRDLNSACRNYPAVLNINDACAPAPR